MPYIRGVTKLSSLGLDQKQDHTKRENIKKTKKNPFQKVKNWISLDLVFTNIPLKDYPRRQGKRFGKIYQNNNQLFFKTKSKEKNYFCSHRINLKLTSITIKTCNQ